MAPIMPEVRWYLQKKVNGAEPTLTFHGDRLTWLDVGVDAPVGHRHVVKGLASIVDDERQRPRGGGLGLAGGREEEVPRLDGRLGAPDGRGPVVVDRTGEAGPGRAPRRWRRARSGT
jgi:hypothetical protein